MNGARVRGSHFDIASQFARRELSETVAAGDLVNVESAQLAVVDAGEVIAGVATEAGVDGDTIEFNNTPGLILVMDNDNDSATFAATDEYKNFDMIGATGAIKIDTSSGTANTAQLRCLKFNPQGIGFDSDESIGLFMPHEVQIII